MYWCTKDCIVLVDIVWSLLEKVYVYLSYFCQIVEIIFFLLLAEQHTGQLLNYNVKILSIWDHPGEL